MKMIKNRVVALLLITFAFFIVHDYVVQDIHQDTRCEVSYKVCDKAEMQIKIHDTIHNIFNVNLQETLFIETKLLDTPPSNMIISLSSNINPVLQRPPLS
ncbi:hypothetical protein Suden_2014 [Sulfurimonas denitrificans DSM 1251]|jgi:hypothetical protein|uniref:Uncharacterized protein n=1 Tax=Sulfurimonas denitrificans (strain ATCC 33889 / DSM 1251) TaxID=326298 RepID=Q30NZ3_SULDN|nr:hypothetical protein [Sulfurimonas denitrificans]ABB45288.1 hypothetical protein Suden_2014 [Sulfurimonas denitrificans DSM 1251]MDD3442087.1 hypothetical protein [Sulfurimonas denitrificans]